MNISKELVGLNKRIQNLRLKENPPTLRMKVLQHWGVEEESDINNNFCLTLKIEDKKTNFNN